MKGMSNEQLKRLYEYIETKNSWGKNELKQLILEVLADIK